MFAASENRENIWREYRLIIIMHNHCRICPPEEGLRKVGPVIDFYLNFHISLVGIQRKPLHSLGSEHSFNLAAPNGYTAVFIFFDQTFCRQKRTRAMVLRPIEFYTSGNPLSGKSHQCLLNDLIVINKVTFFNFIVSHLQSSA